MSGADIDSTARRITLRPLAELRDRYRVDENPVAWGGMGNVWRAYDEDLGRVVAIKSLREELLSDDEARRRFAREIRILAGLSHPCICPVYETYLFEHPPCYSMHWVEGISLARAIDEAQDIRPLITVLLAVCDAVAFAHASGVIHRDLKPANVLLGRFGEVYVMDWGLAKLVGAAASGEESTVEPDSLETGEGTVIGTPAYASPEQAQGFVDRVDARSDVYSLGALLYQILAGVPPYSGTPVVVITQLVTPGKLVRPSEKSPDREIPEALESVALRAMAQDPVDRYASALALRDALRDALSDPMLRTTRRSTGAPPPRGHDPWRWLLAAIAAAAGAFMGRMLG